MFEKSAKTLLSVLKSGERDIKEEYYDIRHIKNEVDLLNFYRDKLSFYKKLTSSFGLISVAQSNLHFLTNEEYQEYLLFVNVYNLYSTFGQNTSLYYYISLIRIIYNICSSSFFYNTKIYKFVKICLHLDVTHNFFDHQKKNFMMCVKIKNDINTFISYFRIFNDMFSKIKILSSILMKFVVLIMS